MFFSFASMWLRPKQRTAFRNVVHSVSSITKKSKIQVFFDVLYSGFAYGSTAQEYENLRFYERTDKNRATFITSYYNLKNYNKLNNRADREIFRDKMIFNQTFKKFIKREWILIEESKTDEIFDFLKRHGSIIIKPRFGDSGKNIDFIDVCEPISSDFVKEIIKKYSGYLAEEVLINHVEIKKFNPSSLNTIRIISIVTKEDVEFLYAGIRIGAPDERVDNISRGGKVAVINLDTGIIESGFLSKTTSEIEFNVADYTGKKIPCWSELILFIKAAARVVPRVKYVAWDVAITDKGPALIEGNHSSGNTITQVSIETCSQGLRPRLEEILKKC